MVAKMAKMKGMRKASGGATKGPRMTMFMTLKDGLFELVEKLTGPP